MHFQVEEQWRDTFMGLLRLLGDEGLGADRTVGMGHFSVLPEVIEREYAVNSKADKWLNLGVFNPGLKVAAIDWGASAYAILNRSGWVSGTSLRRSPVIAIAESALLVTGTGQAPQGAIPLVLDSTSDLIPEKDRIGYDIYRDCRGFFIPTKL
jgi:CRISPR-associated protein Csm4